jgi:cell division protein FtsI (penicillin-binding protein 3)
MTTTITRRKIGLDLGSLKKVAVATPSRNRSTGQQRGPGGRRPNAPTGSPVAAGRRRIRALLLAMVVMAGLVTYRLTTLQLDSPSADQLREIGQGQRLRSQTLPGARGAIFDRYGNELAISVPRPTVWADPSQIEDPKATAEALAAELSVPVDQLIETLSREGSFVYVARKIDTEIANRIGELELAGVFLMDEPDRFYPAGTTGQSLLGGTNVDDVGTSGLELANEEQLRGADGVLVAERDRRGREIPGGEKEYVAPSRGTDLVLTIDRSMQYEAERLLSHQITASRSVGGTLLVMDVKTGDLLAVANMVAQQRGGPVTQAPSNYAAINVFEPGSTAKVVTIAGAMQEGLVNPSTVFSVPDRMQLGPHIYTDHDPHPVENWTTTDILTNSSNIGTILMGQMLGKERIDKYLRDFGFGTKTALGWPNESGGILLPTSDWVSTTMGSVPIGQGLSVTAVQMIASYNTIANGGVYVEPRMVVATIDPNGVRTDNPIDGQRQVVDRRVAQQMTGMMTQVVDVGTGKYASIDGYSVAGKTGTARKPLAGGTGYKPGAYVSSFAGFFPAENPQITMIAILDEPQPIYGGLVAAPLFAEMAKFTARVADIPPTVTPINLRALGVPGTNASALATGGDADAASATKEGVVTPSDAIGMVPTTTVPTVTVDESDPEADALLDQPQSSSDQNTP